MSPIKYLKLLRLEKAKHLLETSFLSVKEITYQVGINDESHFVRDFKKAYGNAPGQHRIKVNEMSDSVRLEPRENIRVNAKRFLLILLPVFDFIVPFVNSSSF